MSNRNCIANEIRALAMQLAALPDVEDSALHREDAGLHKAEDIADHWHERFLTLRDEYKDSEPGTAELWNEMHCRAIGAKRVLDEIRAERKRLAQGDASGDER